VKQALMELELCVWRAVWWVKSLFWPIFSCSFCN